MRERYGLGERVGVQDLRTPAREVKEVEDREWEDARREKERREEKEREKRGRDRERVGWAAPPREEKKERRRVKPLPASSSSKSRSNPKPLASSPAIQALSARLGLASALKADPFLPSSPSSSTSSPRSGGLISADRLRKARESVGLVGAGGGKRKRE